jgi:hypothetical protein
MQLQGKKIVSSCSTNIERTLKEGGNGGATFWQMSKTRLFGERQKCDFLSNVKSGTRRKCKSTLVRVDVSENDVIVNNISSVATNVFLFFLRFTVPLSTITQKLSQVVKRLRQFTVL